MVRWLVDRVDALQGSRQHRHARCAEERAARTVNKERSEKGETKSGRSDD